MRSAIICSLIFHGSLPVLAGLVPYTVNLPGDPKPVMVELAEDISLAPPARPEESPVAAAPPTPSLPGAGPAQGGDRKSGPPRPAERIASRLDSLLRDVPDVPSPVGSRADNSVRKSPPAPDREDAAANASPLWKQADDLEARVRSRAIVSAGGGDTGETPVFGAAAEDGMAPLPSWLREMIGRKVRGYLPGLQRAYTAALANNPRLEGKLLVRLRIDPSGRIRSADPVEASFRDPAFQGDVVETIRRWTFDATGGRTVEVLYPFVFVAPS